MKTVKRAHVCTSLLTVLILFLVSCTGQGRSPASSGTVSESNNKNNTESLVYEDELDLAYGTKFNSILSTLSTLFPSSSFNVPEDIALVQCPPSIATQGDFDKYSSFKNLLIQSDSKYGQAINGVNQKTNNPMYSFNDIQILHQVAEYLFEGKKAISELKDQCESSLATYNPNSSGSGTDPDPDPDQDPDPTPDPVPNPVFASHIYVGTDNGLSLSTNGGESFITRTTAHGLPSNKIWAVYVDDNKVIYVGTEKGIAISTNGGSSFTAYLKSGWLESDKVVRAISVVEGKVYAGTWGEGLYIGVKSGSGYTFSRSSASHLKDSRKYIDGIYAEKIPNSTFHQVLLGHGDNNWGISLSNNSGSSFVYQDLRPNQVSGDPFDKVRRLTKFQGNIYAGTAGGIFMQQGSSKYRFTTMDGLGSNSVRTVAVDKDGKIYAATNSGLSVSYKVGTEIRFNNYNFNLYHDLISDYVSSVAVDNSGGIYVSTWGQGIFISKDKGATFKQTKKEEPLFPGIASNYVRAIVVK